MELSLFLVLILQIFGFHSLRYGPSSCGFESCNHDPAIDDSLNEFIPLEGKSIYLDGIDTKCTAKPSTPESKALDLAQNAADAAQAANAAQAGAAQEASRQVKMQLADKAMDAARTAQTVFAVSLASYNNLVEEIHYEESLMEQMSASLEASEENVIDAEAALKRVEQQAASMKDELEQTRISLAQLEALCEEASADLEAKNRKLAKIKERADLLSQQTEKAKSELNRAKDAACRAKSVAKPKKKGSKKCLPVGRHRKVIPRSHEGCFRRQKWS